jgi:predicted ATPase
VTDVEAAVHAIGDTLGVGADAATPIDALAAHVRARRMLLVLDNLEQVVGVGPVIVELLERAPTLHVLATSRRALRVRGEVEYRVGTLSTPEPNDDLGAIAAAPAVALFRDRTRAVRRDFEVTNDNAALVGALVRQLEGLPLAIELAAAQLRVLSPDALHEQLATNFDVLRSSFADLPERQRTLRATLDWSYALLTDAERALLARLSVFAAGWLLDAAEAVCGETGEPLAETVATLLDKSLIAADHDDASGEPRFRMLEVVRAYAAERLAARGERATYRERHLSWYRALAERAQPGLCGPGQRSWLARMNPERADLRRAVAHALDIGAYDAVVEMAWDVVVLYFVRDAVDEPDGWLRAVSDARPQLPDVTAAKLRSLYALTRIHHGDYDGVLDALLGPLAVFRAEGMDFESAVVLHQLGFVRYHVEHDVDGAVAALEESRALFTSIDHDWGVSLASSMLGSLFAATGELVRAEDAQQQALTHARIIDSEQQTVQAFGQLALIRLLEERYDEALTLLAQSAPALHHGGYRTDAANALDALAVVAYDRGDVGASAYAVCVAGAERTRLGVEPWPTLQPFIDRVHRWVERSLGADTLAEFARRADVVDVFDTLDETFRGLTSAS